MSPIRRALNSYSFPSIMNRRYFLDDLKIMHQILINYSAETRPLNANIIICIREVYCRTPHSRPDHILDILNSFHSEGLF